MIWEVFLGNEGWATKALVLCETKKPPHGFRDENREASISSLEQRTLAPPNPKVLPSFFKSGKSNE